MPENLYHPVSSWVSVGFVVLVATIATLIPLVVYRVAKTSQVAWLTAGALALWLAITGVLTVRGFYAVFDAVPPRFALGVLPAIAAVVLLVSVRRSRELLVAIPAVWIVAFQVFRVPVEAVLFQLGRAGVVPVAMTFEGRNFDILTGLTALPVAYFCFARGNWPRWVAGLWNVMGLLLLANVVGTAIRTAPGPFRALTGQAPNLVPFVFPFSWLPYFLVPLALLGHLVSLAQLARQKSGETANGFTKEGYGATA